MKIAIMLALHNNPKQANIFINQCIQNEGCHVFIHIDKKGMDIKSELIAHGHIHILPKSYPVRWGDYSQIECFIELMKYAKDFGEFDYYSLHSGNDLMVRPFCELADFLKTDHKYAYLDCESLPWSEWQYGGGLGRLALPWPRWMRSRLKSNSLQRYIRSLYGHLYGWHLIPGKRLPTEIQFLGKAVWYTLRSDCVEKCLNYIYIHPEFLDLFRESLCGDEIFFNTLVNITAEDEVVERHNNLRYVDMKTVDKKVVGAPKTLTTDDIGRICESGAFWARKFDAQVDEEIVCHFSTM